MKILVYSPLDEDAIATSLGTADYSYYFVMRRYLPLLGEFGQVIVLDEEPDDESILNHLGGGPGVYLSFTPPNKMAEISVCPCVPVFAWEFDTIPDEAFTHPKDDWVYCLSKSRRAITHSQFAARVVKDRMGSDYDVYSIPAPVWDAFNEVRRRRSSQRPEGLQGLQFNCTVIDSRSYEISNTFVLPRAASADFGDRPLVPAWNGEVLLYDFSKEANSLTFVGFNEAEAWGVWSRSGHPWIMLDRMVGGLVEFEITVVGYGPNIGQCLRIDLGTGSGCLILTEDLKTHRLVLDVGDMTNFMTFSGVERRAEDMGDPRDIGFGISSLKISREHSEEANYGAIELDFSSGDLELEGFHDPEPDGRWSFTDSCMIFLPSSVAGNVSIELEIAHAMHNAGKTVVVRVGERSHSVTLRNGKQAVKFRLGGLCATDSIKLEGLASGNSGNEADSRSLGIQVSKLKLSWRPVKSLKGARWQFLRRLFLDRRKPSSTRGTLYTAILNPSDDRKNWEDIITAFVYAFRENSEACLLIKITNHDLKQYFEDIFSFFKELHPFECRLIFLHGYLSEFEYSELIVHTHYIVNASRGEGQCLPLMEYMSSGVPALAPQNTAMEEYINNTNAFIVGSTPELAIWPHDPRQVYRTKWHRIDWNTLYKGFIESAALLRDSPEKYDEMSIAAVEAQERYCSNRAFRQNFADFLDELPNEGPG